ncbi:hypothetical protein ACJH6J_29860 [Mycobacterium sp. SMC-18]|uniref:hypothetical protein n=1 Tax=unclassified Mycobacterium TaxID=2642494 RepID=UPI003875E486
MYLRIDLAQVPPAVQLLEPDDFSGFKVTVDVPEHAWVAPGTLAALAGREQDDEWKHQLAAMVDFASSRGWIDDTGRVRAHIDIVSNH